MPNLEDVVQDFEARTEGYVRNVLQAAQQADRFGEQNSQAALAARQMGMAAQEAGERAARSQRAAAEAAQRLARGEETAERATQAAARAQRDLERANIAQTRAANAASRAADEQGDQYRQLAREATLAAAAQRLAQLRAAGATEEHDRLLTHLQRRYGDLGREGSGAFRLIGGQAKASGEAMTSPKGMLVKIVAVLGALPWAASAAAAGITLGLGGALVGMGLKAAAGSQKVKDAFSDLSDHVKEQTTRWAKPFEDTLLKTAGFARKTFDELMPDIAAAWARLAPEVTVFTSRAIRSLEEFRPTIKAVTDAFIPLMDTLGQKLPGLMGRTADAFTRIANAADPKALGGFIDGLGKTITVASHAIVVLSKLTGIFTKFGPIAIAARHLDDVGSAFGKLAGQGGAASNATERFQRSMDSAALGSGAASVGIGLLGTRLDFAKQSAQQFNAALDALAGKTLSVRAASRDLEAAVDDASASIKENGKTLNANTEAGRRNQAGLDGIAQKTHVLIASMKDAGSSARDQTVAMNRGYDSFVKAARGAGMSAGAANRLAGQLGLVKTAVNRIPPKKQTKVSAPGMGVVEAGARAVLRALNNIPSRRTVDIILRHIATGAVTGYGYEHHAEGGLVGYANGGQIQGYPGGGMIRGVGTGTSDSNLIAASKGEYVVKAAETDRWLPLLEAVNSGAMSKAARLSAKATSPSLPVTRAVAPAPAQQVVQVTNVHVHVAGHVTTERQLVEVVRAGLAGRSVNNGGNPGTTTGRRP